MLWWRFFRLAWTVGNGEWSAVEEEIGEDGGVYAGCGVIFVGRFGSGRQFRRI